MQTLLHGACSDRTADGSDEVRVTIRSVHQRVRHFLVWQRPMKSDLGLAASEVRLSRHSDAFTGIFVGSDAFSVFSGLITSGLRVHGRSTTRPERSGQQRPAEGIHLWQRPGTLSAV
eukprot:TRINITY_DN28360_c0_g1_i2.p2 TRINITY_DN28360_c0_g1~~TRINITY_DN28360_c0_g1_i2.p2  ORF type:complete len:117 (-),score=11.22 TRINITY_DN28360_c0_g1_i2:43-393(-)